jgi:transglutaminase-like putative cysteine protease
MKLSTRWTGTLSAIFLSAILASSLLATFSSRAANSRTPSPDAARPARTFEFTYKVLVPAIATSHDALRIWIPLPSSDRWQTIADLKIESPVAYQVKTEERFSNQMAYFNVDAQHASAPFEITVHFIATRSEHRVDLVAAHPGSDPLAAHDEAVLRFLQPDRLVPIDGTIGDLSKEQTAGANTQLEKARKIYEYVVATMRYDKSGSGWGHGDAIWACTAKRGNCTDFHSLFDGMARAAGIPARFEIGFPLPDDKSLGDIPGYHCWTEFYIEGIGWIPIDASEAWKHPEKHDYFFGANDVNRVQFSMGRDLRLSPPQQSDRLNYFVYPYAELNGKTFDQLRSHFSFRDVPSAAAGSATAGDEGDASRTPTR